MPTLPVRNCQGRRRCGLALLFLVVVCLNCLPVQDTNAKSPMKPFLSSKRLKQKGGSMPNSIKMRLTTSIANTKKRIQEVKKSPSGKDSLFVFQNLLAGVASAMALVPEAATFAITAGLNPLVGLGSTVIMAGFSGCLGGRPGLVSGASATVALLLAPLVAREGHLVMSLAVIVAGVLQVFLGLTHCGKYIRLVPHPVMLGFVNGLSIKVVKAQIPHFQFPHGVWLQGHALKWHTILVLISALIIDYLPKLTTSIPSSLVALGLATVATNILDLPVPCLVDVVGPETFSGGMKTLKKAMFPFLSESSILPSYSQMFSLPNFIKVIATAAEVAVVGLLQSLLTLQIIDGMLRTRGNTQKESIAQGLGNLASGTMGGMGGSALLGQSLVNVNAGGTGRLSSISVAIFVLLGITFCAPLLGKIPVAALVGLMFTIAEHTFSWSTFKQAMEGKVPAVELAIIVSVCLVTAFQNVAAAVAVGVLASALRFAWQASCNISASETGNKTSRTIRIRGPLFFGSTAEFSNICQPSEEDRAAAENYRTRLKNIYKRLQKAGKELPALSPKEQPINTGREVIIDFIASQVWDHSAIVALDILAREYRELGVKLHLKHLSPDCRAVLIRFSDIFASSTILDVDPSNDPTYIVGDDLDEE